MTNEQVELKEYLETLIAALRRDLDSLSSRHSDRLEGLRRELDQRDKSWQERHAATQLAVDKAESEMRQKLSLMNEFRAALADQSARFVTREQYEELRTRTDKIVGREQYEVLRSAVEKNVSREQFDDLRARVESCASKDEVNPMQRRVSSLEGWQSNMQGRLWGIPMMIGLIVFIVTQLMRVLFPAK